MRAACTDVCKLDRTKAVGKVEGTITTGSAIAIGTLENGINAAMRMTPARQSHQNRFPV
jgi:hypothetical protein